MASYLEDKNGVVRKRRTHCKHGHEFTDESPWATNWKGYSCRVCLVCQRERMRRKREKPGFREQETARAREWRAENPDRVHAAMKRAYEKRSKWIQDQKTKCAYCPESRFACLDFHHRDTKTKFATIGLVRHWPRARLAEEIAKCDVVCANCHRWLHYNEKQTKSAPDAATL